MPPSQQALLPGMYACVRTGGFIGWLIRRVTKSAVNHAFLVTGPGEIIEARPRGGVCRGTLAEYAGMYAVANTRELMTQQQRIAVVAKAETLLGDEYNFAALVDIGLEDLGWHWRFLMRISGAHKHLICSQVVAACGIAAGLPWDCGKGTPDQVAPGDLAHRPGVERITITAD